VLSNRSGRVSSSTVQPARTLNCRLSPTIRFATSCSSFAVVFQPARVWLQRAVDSWLYGDRSDPVRAAAAVTAQLESRVSTPADVLEPIRAALKLPYAELHDADAVVASSGTPVTMTETIPLRHGGAELGALVVGVRVGQRRLDASDRAVLGLVAAPLALAVHATALRTAVERAAEELTQARASERERLRRDLHDGLGPLLTGIALHADAAANLLPGSPDQVQPLVASIRMVASKMACSRSPSMRGRVAVRTAWFNGTPGLVDRLLG